MPIKNVPRQRNNPQGGIALLLAFAAILALASCAPAATDEWWKAPAGPAYQVLVYSFADSDGDGTGDLRGLIDKLDYLNDSRPGSPATDKSLGITALWLSPVHPSPSYHGYDVVDYRAISPKLGTMEDFRTLVKEAHLRGIRIVMDMVFNHSAKDHPWFRSWDKDPQGPHKDYYISRQKGTTYDTSGMGTFHPASGGKEYFAAFWSGMPDLNLGNPAVVRELKDILSFWLDLGVDGFRFDAVKHGFDRNEVPAGAKVHQLNKAFWSDLTAHIKSKKADAYTIGEVLSDSLPEVAGWVGVFDSLFDFPTAKALLAQGATEGTTKFIKTWTGAQKPLNKNGPWYAAHLLSNHDQDRIMSFLQERTSGDRVEALSRARVLAAMVHTLPGLPWIYYGEELGMEGRRYQNDDINRRDGMAWSAEAAAPSPTWTRSSGKVEADLNRTLIPVDAQDNEPGSILNLYRQLAALRRAHPALRNGTLTALEAGLVPEDQVIGWSLAAGAETLTVVHNWSAKAATLAWDAGTHDLVWSSVPLQGDQVLAPRSSALFARRNP